MATLLKLREAARDGRRAELAEAYRVDEVLAQQERQLGQELTWLREQQRRSASPGVINVDRIMDSQRYELTLKAQQAQVARQRAVVAEEIERRRAALVEANRDVRSLELLREHQMEKFRQDESRRDIKRLDEVAQQRALRREAV